MNRQYAVLGMGRFGESVARSLQDQGCEVIVVDDSMEKIDDMADAVSYAMCADFNDPDVINALGARELDGVVVAVAGDLESSIMATLLSKEAGVPYILAKARDDRHAAILKKIGADEVVFPEKEMGIRTARHLIKHTDNEQ